MQHVVDIQAELDIIVKTNNTSLIRLIKDALRTFLCISNFHKLF